MKVYVVFCNGVIDAIFDSLVTANEYVDCVSFWDSNDILRIENHTVRKFYY